MGKNAVISFPKRTLRFATLTAPLLGAIGIASSALANPVSTTVNDVLADAATSSACTGVCATSGYSNGVAAGYNNGWTNNQIFKDVGVSGRYWGDSVQGNSAPFDTRAIIVTRDYATRTVTFDMITAFGGNDVFGSLSTRYADLFIDTHNPSAPDTFNYAISLGMQTAAAGAGINAQGNGGVAAGLYSLTTYKTSYDIWSKPDHSGFIYGGYATFDSQVNAGNVTTVITPATVVTDGSSIATTNFQISQSTIGTSSPYFDSAFTFYDEQVTLTLADPVLFDKIFGNFDIFWGTGDCSNDAVWGTLDTVPAPGALALLSLGVLGLGGLRRKAKGE